MSQDRRAHDRNAAHLLPKPLMRGWSHAVAAVAAAITTIALVLLSGDGARALSMLVFGLSMIVMYVVSAIYHIGRWRPEARRVLRALDHANIYLLIAGTFTPLCFNVLDGPLRTTMLIVIWSIAFAGIGLSAFFTEHLPRFVTAGLYIGMGWMGIVVVPAFAKLMPWPAVATLLLGGLLYTLGALVYALRRPDPYPQVFGFHEVFHLFVIGGSAAFTVTIWVWVLPFGRAGVG